MLAVSGVDAAKAWYATFKRLQEEAANKSATYKPLRIATIFSLPPMKNKNAIGEISDETLIPAQWTAVLKSFWTLQFVNITAILKLTLAPTVTVFQNYYPRDLAQRVKIQDIDLLNCREGCS